MSTHPETLPAVQEVEITYPPPPKTVEIWNPHEHKMVPVFAYAHSKDVDEPMQRVLWNPVQGRWEMDPERAKWQKARGNAKVAWTLSTIWPTEVMSKRETRYKNRLEETEHRLAEVERQLKFLLDQFDLQLPPEE